MKRKPDYTLVPTATLEQRVKTRRSDEKLVKVTLEVPEDNVAEIEAIADVMRGDAGLFRTHDLIV